MTIELVGHAEIRHKKGKYQGIICRLCKSDETRTQSNGNPIWIKDKTAKGNWIGQFLCYKCFYEIDKICYKCGSEQIIKSISMLKHYNGNGLWTGKYICQNCHNRSRKDYRNRNIILTIQEGEGSIMDVIIATVLGIQTCSIYAGDKKLPFSLIHGYHGIIGVKSSELKNNRWYFNLNDYVYADTYFCIGFSEKLRNINAIYVIPTRERLNDDRRLKTGRLSITKNSKKYNKFEIDADPYDHIYNNMDIGEYPIKLNGRNRPNLFL